MPVYIVQVKLSERAFEEIKELPAQIRSEFDEAAQMGVKLHGLYVTLGEYDVVCIFEAPSEEIALAGLLEINTRGLGKTETTRAFTFDEFQSAAAQLG
jgi:uncharacterized protein with GYD domain